ncbi:hypothetical protein [Polyangium sp. 15x6]|uniref:hypothetical protein n=1 Tax=Polyangium sp. 15x6 TaxID=3042687 RepID=UPI00249AD7C3|nr:hypothetical protein [Polyangium sp. 15x6]MDI3290677.1 hypothetical protein [Polyangium sp. 15x6]
MPERARFRGLLELPEGADIGKARVSDEVGHVLVTAVFVPVLVVGCRPRGKYRVRFVLS